MNSYALIDLHCDTLTDCIHKNSDPDTLDDPGRVFYAGDVTGKRGAVFDGQKGCGFAGIPRSLHIGSGVAGSDAVTEFLHLPIEVIPVRLIVIDRGLPAVFVRNEYRVELCPVDIGRDRG